MLTITIPAIELYDEKREEFVVSKAQTLQLEHSLVSLSKWESHYKKPFLTKEDKSFDETIFYVKCMTVTQNVDPSVYKFITRENIAQVGEYIDDPMTATTFSNQEKSKSRETMTAELIYYWMIALNIPFECQKWHLNRLLTLINVCNIKNKPPKKTSKKDLMNRNRALNEARRNALNTKG